MKSLVIKSPVAADQPIKSGNSFAMLLLITPILTATVLSKIAVPPLGAQGIGIALPVVLGMMLFGCLLQKFEIAPRRFVFGALVLACLGLMQLLRGGSFYTSSLVLLAALHLPYILQLKTPVPPLQQIIRFFTSICTLCAWLAIAQFLLQPFIASQWLFPIETFLPEPFRVQLFNAQATLEYESTVLRANGVFMFEPSFLSQLLAIGIIIELNGANRLGRLLLFGVGILVSYSGTGLVVLAVCIPLTIILQGRWQLLVCGVVVMLVAALLMHNMTQYLYLDKLLARATEFNSTGSSGFARFVGGFYLFDQFLWSHPINTLFGMGAGMFKEYAPLSHVPVAEMPLFKMVFEFGLCGALLYFAFLIFCLSSAPVAAPIVVAIGLTFLLNGLYVPFSHALAFSLLIWPSASVETRLPDPNAAETLNPPISMLGMQPMSEAP